MKLAYIATGATACVLLFLGGAMAKLPAKALPLSAWIFFGVQFIGCGAAFIGLQKFAISSGAYDAFYRVSLLATIFSACVVAGYLHRETPSPLVGFLAIGALIFSLALASLTYSRLLEVYGGAVPGRTLLLLFQFAGLAFCAALAAGAWTQPQTETDRILTLGLGAYWFAMAAWTLAYTVESVRGREQWDLWQRRAGVWPALIALVCFAWITYRFVSIQAELSRAPSREMEQEVAAALQEVEE
jgi:hypothetical protein